MTEDDESNVMKTENTVKSHKTLQIKVDKL